MSNAKRGLKALGLTLMAAMGLMAFLAAGAQAVTWDLNGKEITSNVTFSGNAVTGTTSLLLVPAQNLVIHCTGLDILSGTLIASGNTAHITIQYLGCTTKVKGVESKGCQPEILVVKALVKSTAGGLTAEPLTVGQPFTTLHYNEETCALPPLPTITGKINFECYTGALVPASCATSRVKQLIRVSGGGFNYGLNPASAHSETEMFLTGADTGIAFNAL